MSEELSSSNDTNVKGLKLDGLLPGAVILRDMINKDQPVLCQDATVKVSEELGSFNDTSNEGLTLDGRSLRALISPDKIKKEPCSDDETSPPTFSIVNAMEEIAASMIVKTLQ